MILYMIVENVTPRNAAVLDNVGNVFGNDSIKNFA